MDRTTILDSYVLSEDTTPPIITSPGKFEGEALYVPYFWDQFPKGTGGTLGANGELIFDITPEDREQFPELGRRTTVILIEDDNDQVCEV
jgi:hypothetical protein